MYRSDHQTIEKIARAYSMADYLYLLRGGLLLVFIYRSFFWRQLMFFAENMGPKHLEIPVGNGFVLKCCLRLRRLLGLELPSDSCGADISEKMLQYARARFQKLSSVSLGFGNVEGLGFSENQFDSVNIPNGFHCFPNASLALKELHRVLKAGGRLRANILLPPQGNVWYRKLASKFIDYSIKRGDLHRPYTTEELKPLISASGFAITEWFIDGNTLYVEATKEEMIAQACAQN